jgi:hypothetical protein
MDLEERLRVGVPDDVGDCGGGSVDLPLNRHENVHIVKVTRCLRPFRVRLDGLVLRYRAGQVQGQVAGQRERFTGYLVLRNGLPGRGYIQFEQGVNAVLPPIQITT